MTILHVLDHSAPVMSGYSSRSRSVLLFQREMGLRPVVVTSPKHGGAGASREVLDGIPHCRTRASSAVMGRVRYVGELQTMLRLARQITKTARAEAATILHAHSPVLNGLPTLWAGRRLRVPVVYEARAFWEDAAVDQGRTRATAFRYRLSRALETVVFKRADRVVTIAEAMRQEVIQRGVAPDRVSVVPNGVDTTWFRPEPRRPELARRLGLDGQPVLGFIGSFYRYEGLGFLLEALPAVRARLPGCRLLLVGAGEEEAALRAAAAPLGNAVVFAGRVSHEGVRDFYTLIDVFVCPRRRVRLTELVTPLKPLEAMAMGLPVLASDVGGLAELIRDGETGVLFSAESHQAFVEAAVRLGASAEARTALGKRARVAVERERSWRRVVTGYRKVYEAVA